MEEEGSSHFNCPCGKLREFRCLLSASQHHN
jgi:hypothetical protein